MREHELLAGSPYVAVCGHDAPVSLPISMRPRALLSDSDRVTLSDKTSEMTYAYYVCAQRNSDKTRQSICDAPAYRI